MIMLLGKPYFNGANWVVNELGTGGIVKVRHKFNTEQQANEFYNQQIDKMKLKPKGQENKLASSPKENKGI